MKSLLIAATCTLVTCWSQAAAPLTYPNLVQEVRKGGNIAKRLQGQPVSVSVKKSGNRWAVKPADQLYFVCASSDPSFKGGALNAKIVKYEENDEEMTTFITVDRCAP